MKPLLTPTKNYSLIVLAVLILASGLRLFRLNEIPYGFYWDEAAITYNAWGIAEWNRDEFGHKLPLSFKSFGDYKAPLLIYLLGITYKVTGLEISYLRIIIAIFGIVNVLLVYLIGRQLKPKDYLFALFSLIFMALTPWAIHFSRIGVEAQLALSLVLAGTYLMLLSPKHTAFLYSGIGALALSIYAYHSAKIFIPLLLPGILIGISKRKYKLTKKSLIIASAIFIILIIPLLHDSIFGEGFERGKTLILFQNGQLASFGDIITQFLTNLFDYLKPSFWVQNLDTIGLRHGVPGHGLLFYSTALLALIGIILSVRYLSPLTKFLLLWLVAGMAPAVLAQDSPHAIRSLLALPALTMLAAFATHHLFNKLSEHSNLLGKTFVGLVILFAGLELIGYQQAYYASYAIQSAPEFQYGYREAITTAEILDDADDKIIVTTAYGQPYIYTLLYRGLTPEQFKFGALANYEFKPIDWSQQQSNRIYIGTPEEIPPTDPAVVHLVTIPHTNIPTFVIAKL